MILICRTCPDWSCERESKTQGCHYAVVKVTADLLIRVVVGSRRQHDIDEDKE